MKTRTRGHANDALQREIDLHLEKALRHATEAEAGIRKLENRRKAAKRVLKTVKAAKAA